MTESEIRKATLDQLRIGVALAIGWQFKDGYCSNPRDRSRNVFSWMRLEGNLPNWPTDDRDAVALTVEMSRRGWGWGVDNGGDGVSACVSAIGSSGEVFAYDEPTFALAVCRAFLLACEAAKGSQ